MKCDLLPGDLLLTVPSRDRVKTGVSFFNRYSDSREGEEECYGGSR